MTLQSSHSVGQPQLGGRSPLEKYGDAFYPMISAPGGRLRVTGMEAGSTEAFQPRAPCIALRTFKSLRG